MHVIVCAFFVFLLLSLCLCFRVSFDAQVISHASLLALQQQQQVMWMGVTECRITGGGLWAHAKPCVDVGGADCLKP